jgi:trehalose 6-phosphate synthase/phosphatase
LRKGETDDAEDGKHDFRYRYAVHRAGVFFRMEQPDDAGDHIMKTDDDTPQVHQVPLRLLHHRESYVVNDVLGSYGNHPDIDHITVPNKTVIGSGTSHIRKTSTVDVAAAAMQKQAGDVQRETSQTHGRKKVGFAPAPPTYHPISSTTNTTAAAPPTTNKSATKTKNAVHLNSTDGLVVVSAFLPVVLHRSDQGHWTADWDYEALLSMQTHLRVTRIGVVKWRGWHGNFGVKEAMHQSSMGSGVPVNERHLVEECLRPFHCVPVWIDTTVFGEM